jgi:hypothetical protein
LEKDKITPSCLYRNCVQFKVPGYTESIVVIDSFEYIEVHVHTRADTASELERFATFCGTIRDGIIQAVRKATKALNYDYHEPSLCFGCPCDHPVFHTATIRADKTRWICSRDEYDKVLVANQRIWLKEEKDTVSHTPVENKPLPPSVALTLNQQATSSDSTPVLRTLNSTSEQSPSKPIDSQQLKDNTTPKSSQQRVSESTPERSYHESSPTIRLVSQEEASASINPTPQVETSPNATLDIDSKPKLHQLGYLKLNNQRIKVIERVASRWESVATQLHFEGHLIDTIKMESHYQVDSACRKMFIKWLEGVGRQPIIWRTLIDALDEAGLPRVSHELNNIIHGTQESQFHGSSPSTRRRRAFCAI